MDSSRRSAWLSEFEDVDEVARWATGLGARVNRPEIRRLWESRRVAVENGMAKDYRLFVVERRRGRPRLEIYGRGAGQTTRGQEEGGDKGARGQGDSSPYFPALNE
jgi:hypothetical protein